MRVFGDAGDELTFDAYAATVERLATIVEESELARVLDAACDYQPAITRIDATFQALETPSTGTAELQLADGRRVSVALLVGADGANSAAARLPASTRNSSRTSRQRWSRTSSANGPT